MSRVPEGAPGKRSAVEIIKENSRHLRGALAQELAQPSDHFSDDDKQLLKFHGSYQQDDRDARKDRHKDGGGKSYIFMVRCKIPGGRVSADQYLAIDDIAGRYANGTLRITSRQGFQLHGVLKQNLKETIAGINHCLLTTLGACGDVERNVMAPSAPLRNPVYDLMQELADHIALHLAPRSRAYHEVWLNGDDVTEVVAPEVEPIYGKVYLPRKFKTGFAIPEDNSVDIFAQDLGFLGQVRDGRIVGFNVLVGGGMGMTHGNATTFPFISKPMCYAGVEQVVPAAEAVVKLYRDHGNRAERKRARIKYLVHDWGVEKFRKMLATYLPFPLVLPKPLPVTGFPLHLGWHAQGDGKYWYGVSVENGRIKDDGPLRLRSALRDLVQRFRANVRLTPMQDILLCDLPEAARPEIERSLRDHGVLPQERLSLVQLHSMACPAIPTCGLAISEAERTLPRIIDQLEAELTRLGLDNEKIGVRMTGCPNGCVRPYQSDIGIVGRSGDKYTLFVGGNLVGDRLNFVLNDLVPAGQIVATLLPLLELYRRERHSQEGFGDFCQRLGQGKLQALLT
ncbi:MAG: NADPH-dependent assimilatory sulfite reductase hemoprotein subunit [Gemmataceae bacterium]|nr:NADPH-dependent assimilatory sulfite reductase hemoprotein subunit [Gemmataceae bacterium]MCI0743404.1 NADPH-dependent assimilatory sulfite reductase hemoprotein subunit [Gemmataceae bacterium]